MTLPTLILCTSFPSCLTRVRPMCGNGILRRIIRGLCHYHEFSSAIVDDRILCDVMRYFVPEAFQPEINWHEIAPEFYQYGYSILDDEHLHTFWLIQFSKHIEFFGVIAASDSGFLA